MSQFPEISLSELADLALSADNLYVGDTILCDTSNVEDISSVSLNPSSPARKKAKSKAWALSQGYGKLGLTESGSKAIFCQVKGCSKYYLAVDSSTTSFNKHITKHHHVAYGTENAALQPRIFGLENPKPAPVEGVEYSSYLHQSILNYMLLNNIPHSQLDSVSFKQMVVDIWRAPNAESLAPLSSWTYRRLLTSTFMDYKPRVKALLQQQESVSITLDMWTSPNHHAFMGIVAHFIDADWTPQSVVIGMEHMVGSHTAEAQSEQVMAVLADFGIVGKVFTITTDSASVMNKMALLLGSTDKYPEFGFNHLEGHIPCFAHVINLVCQDAINVGFSAPAWVVDEDGITVIQAQEVVEDKPVNKLLNQLRKTVNSIM